MNERQTTILVDRETAAALLARAQSLGVSVDVYLRQVAGTPAPTESADLSGEQFEKTLDEFFALNPRRLPSLPTHFSRADIYADHD